MGLNDDSTTLVAPKPKGIIDPRTGKPIGHDDAFFGEINNELAEHHCPGKQEGHLEVENDEQDGD